MSVGPGVGTLSTITTAEPAGHLIGTPFLLFVRVLCTLVCSRASFSAASNVPRIGCGPANGSIVVHSTRHDELAASDYRLLQQYGIRDRAGRPPMAPYRAEPRAATISRSATGMLRAGRDTGMQVIWDLWHYGWPDDIDIFSAAFVDRFTAFAREAAARHQRFDRCAARLADQRDLVFLVGGRRGRDLQPVCQAPRRRDEAAAGARVHPRDRRDPGREPRNPHLPDRSDHQRRCPRAPLQRMRGMPKRTGAASSKRGT